MNTTIKGNTYDEERALYGITDATVEDCHFEGPADGESALKETRNIKVKDCSFSLRYPLWHVDGFTMEGSKMDDKARAAIWYSKHGVIENCDLGGIKVIRECDDITIRNSKIDSFEFAWSSRGITIEDTSIHSEYGFLTSSGLKLKNVDLTGKYYFQYIENSEFENINITTKDAFWHAKNVTVRDSVLSSEYLAWYSENLTLINCKIISMQPLCYCKGLKLINCTMENTNLAFEYSDVDAEVIGHIDSIKNPLSGRIVCDSVGEIVRHGAVYDCNAEIIVRS
ncbi:MAG: DUF3737 family protein [Lachnospiraceae bacterium]|nr:DUF3737 family protein [Lachnospiraceae bacterium]